MIDPTTLSGRELDAAIAEYIYDWVWVTTEISRHPSDPEKMREKLSALIYPVYAIKVSARQGFTKGKSSDNVFIDGNAPTISGPGVPNYSGDDALALQVADKVGLFEKGYVLLRDALDTFSDDEADREPVWIVTTENNLYWINECVEKYTPIGAGTTRAEALCRASLVLAMEGK